MHDLRVFKPGWLDNFENRESDDGMYFPDETLLIIEGDPRGTLSITAEVGDRVPEVYHCHRNNAALVLHQPNPATRHWPSVSFNRRIRGRCRTRVAVTGFTDVGDTSDGELIERTLEGQGFNTGLVMNLNPTTVLGRIEVPG